MTTVTFRTEKSRITGFTVQGHSDYADAGEDIVCAAVTSSVRLIEAAVNDVLGLSAPVLIREEIPSVTFRLPGGLSDEAETTCQTLLTAFMLYGAQLHEEYPEFLEVLEQD